MRRADSIVALVLADLLVVACSFFISGIDGEFRALLTICCLGMNIPCYQEWNRARNGTGGGGLKELAKLAGGFVCVTLVFIGIDIIVWKANPFNRDGWQILLESGGLGFGLTAIVAAGSIFYISASALKILVSKILRRGQP